MLFANAICKYLEKKNIVGDRINLCMQTCSICNTQFINKTKTAPSLLGHQYSPAYTNSMAETPAGTPIHRPAPDVLAPKRLFKQIVLLQIIYYAIATILICFADIVGGMPVSPELIFSWEPVRFDTSNGWILALLWLLDTFFSVLAMTFIVGRSKLALDFTLTLHGINIIVAWLASGRFPSSPLWWCLQLVSVVLMVSLGTWTSQWRELRVTFFEEAYELVDQGPQGERGT